MPLPALVAAGKEHHGQGPTCSADTGDQVDRRRRLGVAVLVLQLDAAGVAVARQVQHVELVVAQRPDDLGEACDLQDADLGRVGAVEALDGGHHRIQFGLQIEGGFNVRVSSGAADQDHYRGVTSPGRA